MRRLKGVADLAQTSVLLTCNNNVWGPVFEENRITVPLQEVAESVVKTLVAVEDKRFFSHHGLDLKAILRAAYVNLRSGRIVQGGSTITQQLARIAILRRSDRTLRRKLFEGIVALLLERQFTKKGILEYYLNAAYFGHNVYGIELAALTFCRKSCKMLDYDDAAYLVGLLKAPARYCRCCKPEAAKRRTSLALRLAGRTGSVDHSRRSLQTRRLRSSYANRLPLTSGYVTQYARSWLNQYLRAYYPSRRLIVETTIDPRCQIVLETVCAGVRTLGYRGRLACVVQDARSGAIQALTGGVAFRLHEFNSATDGFLQPGSLLKPFILLAALQKGIGLDCRYESRPFTFKSGTGANG